MTCKAKNPKQQLKFNIRVLFVPMLVGLLQLSACSGDVEVVNREAVTKEVTERMAAFVTAINSGDTEALIDFYSQSERFYWIEDGQVTYPNYKVVADALSGLYTTLESAEMRVLDTKIEVLSSNRVNYYSEYEQDLKMKSGYAFSINGAMTVLMEKEAGVWRFVIGHSSTKKERGQ